MTFIFDGGKVLRCEACGFRMYLGAWDLTRNGWWPRRFKAGPTQDVSHGSCIPCGGEMVETHIGGPDGWVEIEAVGA